MSCIILQLDTGFSGTEFSVLSVPLTIEFQQRSSGDCITRSVGGERERRDLPSERF